MPEIRYMKRFFSLLMLTGSILCSAIALAAAPDATFVPAKWFHHQRRDPRVTPHHAHKAGKHQTPKRQRHHQTV